MCDCCLKNNLRCSVNGGHTRCPRDGGACFNAKHISPSQPFIAHCKFCLAPEIRHTQDTWLDENGNIVRNAFLKN
jgi:hypothetical protein